MRIFALLAVCALLTALPSAGYADPNFGVIRGYVYLEGTHTPACGVRVIADQAEQWTDSMVTGKDGFFVFLARFTGLVHVFADDNNPNAEKFTNMQPNMTAPMVLFVKARRYAQGQSRCSASLHRAPSD